jgi:hypothetical protein
MRPVRFGCPCVQQHQGRDHPLNRMMPKPKPLPSAKRVRQLLDYDQATGHLRWKIQPARNVFAGSAAGTVNKTGYLCVGIDKKIYRANRIIWLWMTGEDPGPDFIDHIDGDKLNNAFCNLRKASCAQNNRNRKTSHNNTSGYKGVCWHKHEKKWYVSIRVNGIKKHIGCFFDPEMAHAAYCKAAAEFHGEFARVA